MKLALVIPDCHIPNHHKKAYGAMMNAASDLKIDEVTILGDYLDCYEVMSHQRHPRVFTTLEQEFIAANKELDFIDKQFKGAKKVFIEGNHEDRLERYIINNAPSLFGVTETSRLLQLDQRPNWKFVKWGPTQQHRILDSKLHARHRPPTNNVKSNAKEAGCNLVYGDIHKIEMGYHNTLKGEQRVAFSVGWLGDKRKDLIFGYVKNHHQWQMGFGLVYVDGDKFYPVTVPIHEDGSCVVNGKKYKG